MTTTADILVIGGGMAGIGAAARVSPDASVIVLEAEDAPGRHSTGRSAAIFIGNYGNETVRAANAASQGELAAPPDDLAESSLLTPRGELLIAPAEEEARFEAHMSAATSTDEISPDEAVRLFPILKRERIVRACYDNTAEDIDVDRLLQGYLRLLRRNGGTLGTDARVQEIKRADRFWKLSTAAGDFEAPVVVNAAGDLTDAPAELDAALAAGMRTTWLLRPGEGGPDPTAVHTRHDVALSFDEVRP